MSLVAKSLVDRREAPGPCRALGVLFGFLGERHLHPPRPIWFPEVPVEVLDRAGVEHRVAEAQSQATALHVVLVKGPAEEVEELQPLLVHEVVRRSDVVLGHDEQVLLGVLVWRIAPQEPDVVALDDDLGRIDFAEGASAPARLHARPGLHVLLELAAAFKALQIECCEFPRDAPPCPTFAGLFLGLS